MNILTFSVLLSTCCFLGAFDKLPNKYLGSHTNVGQMYSNVRKLWKTKEQAALKLAAKKEKQEKQREQEAHDREQEVNKKMRKQAATAARLSRQHNKRP